MNFTREPIIETIISPREGCKLLVRSSKGGGQSEEYYVDALEVVSFGRAFFFRSMERPKAFLVPASDYEVLEVKETRVALKNISHERQIKIGGGRDASMRHPQREPVPERESEPVAAEEEQPAQPQEAGMEAPMGSRMEKRRDRRRRRHRRSDEDWAERRTQQETQAPQQPEAEQKLPGGGGEDETKVSSSMFSSLIPPPPTLISETLSRYKDKEFAEGASFPKEELEEKKEERKSKKEDSEDMGSDSAPLHRTTTMTESVEASSFTSTNFSPLPSGRDPFFF